MIITPKTRGFICTTSHPDGCYENVKNQISYVKSQNSSFEPKDSFKKVLVIGASTGYGLASRIVSAFGNKASTIGVFFEKPGKENKTASAGWYNSYAFEEEAKKEGLYAKSINGDAFSNEIKQQTIDLIKKDLGQIDTIIYSLASPRRTDPKTSEVYRSVLKPTAKTFKQKSINTETQEIIEVEIEPANDEEINHTVKVMGGEDWKMWIDLLSEEGVLSEGFKTFAYSYIGPDLTYPIYTDGTIGRAKIDLYEHSEKMNEIYGKNTAFVSINKALVTQASSAIPVVPLYISILYKVMKNKGTHEGCIEQMHRLFSNFFNSKSSLIFDEENKIRIDDLEMDDEVQAEVEKMWGEITTENLLSLSDFEGYKKEFLSLFGFNVDLVDYVKDTDPIRNIPSLS